MELRPIALLLALALALGGLVAIPALAEPGNGSSGDDAGNAANSGPGSYDDDEDEDDDNSGPGNARDRRHAAYADAQTAYRDRKAALRQEYTDIVQNTTRLHAQCIRDVLAAANGTVDREAIDDCHERFKEERKDLFESARERYKAAKEAARERYHDRLDAARADYLSGRDRGHDGFGDDRCAEHPECVERQIAHLEAKLERAENVSLHLQTKLERLHLKLEELRADNNTTDWQLYRVQDAIMGVQIQLLKVDRVIFRIEAQLAHWQGIQDGTITVSSADDEAADDADDVDEDEMDEDDGDDEGDDDADDDTDDEDDTGNGDGT